MRVAGGIVPGAVPEILGEDRASGCFAMAYLSPDTHPVWKDLLRTGIVESQTAAAVGDVLGRIHAATADRADVAARFETDELFHALRLEPYLEATATRASRSRASARCAGRDHASHEARAGPRRLQPEEPVDRPGGPGDPRRRMRVVRRPGVRSRVRAESPAAQGRVAAAMARAVCRRLRRRWRPRIWRMSRWEPPASCEARAAALLPGLMLARIDGKSPVEYLTDDRGRTRCALSRDRSSPIRLRRSVPSRSDGSADATTPDERSPIASAFTAAASGIRAGGRRSRRRSCSTAARSDAPSRPRARRAARARRSICATAARASAAWT